MFGFDILCCFWFGGLFLFCRTSAFRGKIYEIVSGGCPLPSQIVLWTKRAALLPNNDPDVAVLGLRLAAWTSHLRTRTFRELDNLSEGLDSATYMEQFLGLSTPMSVMEYLEKLARSRSPRRHYQGLTDSTDSSD